MTTYVAFLRAINLGARRQFPKDAVAAATTGAGFDGVATHINTGNVRLETRMRSRARIEAALEAAYLADRGFEVPTMVFGCDELRGVLDDADRLAAERVPGADGGVGRHYVSLLKDEPTPSAAADLESRSTEREQVRVRGRAVHLMLGESYHEAALSNVVVERALGVATNRNLTVVRALVQKWC